MQIVNLYDFVDVYSRFYRNKEFGRRRSVPDQCRFFDRIINKHIKDKKIKLLELACGPAYHTIWFGQKDYEVAGLDINKNMLSYAAKTAAKKGVKLELYLADIKNFFLPKRFDVCLNTHGSVSYIIENGALINHLKCVSRVLRPRGLYIVVLRHPKDYLTEKIGLSGSGHNVKTEFDFKSQTIKYIENYEYDGKRFNHTEVRRIILPQEFDLINRSADVFDIIEQYGGYSFDKKVNDKDAKAIVFVLRRK